VAGNIILGWVITFPAAGTIACLLYLVVRPLFS
jgi:PiT family inorganic phosphate transporter